MDDHEADVVLGKRDPAERGDEADPVPKRLKGPDDDEQQVMWKMLQRPPSMDELLNCIADITEEFPRHVKNDNAYKMVVMQACYQLEGALSLAKRQQHIEDGARALVQQECYPFEVMPWEVMKRLFDFLFHGLSMPETCSLMCLLATVSSGFYRWMCMLQDDTLPLRFHSAAHITRYVKIMTSKRSPRLHGRFPRRAIVDSKCSSALCKAVTRLGPFVDEIRIVFTHPMRLMPRVRHYEDMVMGLTDSFERLYVPLHVHADETIFELLHNAIGLTPVDAAASLGIVLARTSPKNFPSMEPLGDFPPNVPIAIGTLTIDMSMMVRERERVLRFLGELCDRRVYVHSLVFYVAARHLVNVVEDVRACIRDLSISPVMKGLGRDYRGESWLFSERRRVRVECCPTIADHPYAELQEELRCQLTQLAHVFVE